MTTPLSLRASRAALAAVFAFAAPAAILPREARAEPPPVPDPYDIPLAPRPPTLPELTHHDYEISGETTFGVITPSVLRALTYDGSEVGAVVQRIGFELPLSLRPHVYVGGTYEIAAGTPPGGGAFKLVPSNLDVYGRIVWATHTGMAFGGGVGVLAPTAHFGEGDDASKVAAAAQAIRPWDNAFFLDDAMTFRAFADVRTVDGRFVLQFREGLEGSVSLAGNSPQVAAIAQAYTGFRVIPLLGIGLEAFETYLINSPNITTIAQDHDRATFTISPDVRLMTPYVQPALGFITSIGTPLFGFGSVEGFWAIRVGASVVWDPATKKVGVGAGGK